MAGKKGRKQYTEAFKQQLADEFMRGELNMPQLMKKYGVASFASVSVWIHKYGYKDYESGEKQANRPRRARQSKGHNVAFRKKVIEGLETGVIPEFDNDNERYVYTLIENVYLKKKLLDMGESKTFIASLWSSKNLVDDIARLGLADVLE